MVFQRHWTVFRFHPHVKSPVAPHILFQSLAFLRMWWYLIVVSNISLVTHVQHLFHVLISDVLIFFPQNICSKFTHFPAMSKNSFQINARRDLVSRKSISSHSK